ncbi:MAG: protein kinase [Candidatus Lokiarchaeota archaeon]|nr:protein kinase [Candidatus Lokiarchaeota archaeon]MBD3341009.1 protein kinase [Candidatus Lokiarchaeota archaeon]
MFSRGQNGDLLLIVNKIDGELRVLKVYRDPVSIINEADLIEDAKKLAKFKNTNIVKLFETGNLMFEGERYFFIIMEYIERKSFGELIPVVFREKTSFNERLNLFTELLETIISFRKDYELHNDLHPGNIMLYTECGERKIKIIDFGTSKDTYNTGKQDYDIYMLRNNILDIFVTSDELFSQGIDNPSEIADFNDLKKVFLKNKIKNF